jgi:hypothetical protein
MENYTNSEMTDVVLCYGSADGVGLRLLHSNKTFGRGVVKVAEVFRILRSVKHCSRYPLETRQS